MSNLNTRMPTGDDVTKRIDPKPAFSTDLFEQLLQPANLQRAWKQFRANKGAAGVDGMSVDGFPAWVVRNLLKRGRSDASVNGVVGRAG